MGWFLFLSLCFLLLYFPSYTSSMLPLCNHDEASALLQFKNSFLNISSDSSSECPDYGQPSYPKTQSWENGTNCCLWDGVTCDTKSGHVIGLDLSCSWLQGKLHPNSTLFQLTHLQKLNLAHNYFLASRVFSGFGDLLALTHLNLSYSGFHGVISSKISHLSKLVSLDLSFSNRMRFEPSTLEKLIANTTDLRELALDYLNMSSIKPSSLSLLVNFSSSLVSLGLYDTGLHGMLAESLLLSPNLQKLDLSGNKDLNGELPKFNWSTPLKYLDISYTAFSGKVSSSIGHLKSLNILDFSNANFEGPILPFLSNLTELTYLELGYNQFSGEIQSSLSNLHNLAHIGLANFNFEGPIPLWLGNLTQLNHLNLAFNNFSGEIPGLFGKLSKLEDLYLSQNRLQGDIPNSIFDLQNLLELGLSSNNLSGLVDFEKISKLQNLFELDLSYNNFLSLNFNNGDDYTFPFLYRLFLSSCNIISFPKFLNRLKNLEYLDLSNNQIHGKIPNWFNNTGKDNLSYLDLSHNLLTSVGYLSLSWRNIWYINLSFNMLEGDIPIPPFGTEIFSISNNKLTGDISSAICNASSLSILNLSHNNLTGKLPQCLGTFPSLTVLDLQRNNLYGVIPRTYFEIKVLETINLSGNKLKGPLPQSMVKCRQLKVMDLGENNIKDIFPSWLESLPELQVLVLRANRFNGIITSLKGKHTFPKLRIFDVSNNNFSGTLPTTYIKNFKGMAMNVYGGLQYMNSTQYSYRYKYNDSVVITIKGNIIEMERILTTFTTIDLSNNSFEGEIPTIIGELKSLKGLNLSHNRIIGSIPQSFGDLKNLEWLDLSSNNLIGEIPKALTNLYSLSFLNLSQNQLEGIIPTGKQFNTFQNDSYQGNPGLCGLPLSKSCHGDGEQPRDSEHFQREEEFGFGWEAVVVGYASGVVFGILLGFIAFLIGKPRWLINFVEDIASQGVRKKSYRLRTNRKEKK